MNALLLFMMLIGTPNAPAFVESFHALDGSSEEQAFIRMYEDNTDAGVQAYVLTVRLKQLDALINPYTKWTRFKSYTAKMDALAAKHPENIHVRYCRLMLQEKAPSFLGYTEHIAGDRVFLKGRLDMVDETDYMDPYIKKNTSL